MKLEDFKFWSRFLTCNFSTGLFVVVEMMHTFSGKEQKFLVEVNIT